MRDDRAVSDMRGARAAVLDAAPNAHTDGASSWHLRQDGLNRIGMSVVVLPEGLYAPALGWTFLTPGSEGWRRYGLPAPQTVIAEVPNWCAELLVWSRRERIDSGERMPGPLDVPVWVDAGGAVTGVARDQLAQELEPWREAGVRVWKQDHSPLSGVRSAVSAPKGLLRFGGSLIREWKDAIQQEIADLKTSRPMDVPRPDDASHPPVEGVGYELWIQIRALLARDEVHPQHVDHFTHFRGVPWGRWAAVEATWQQRAADDPRLKAWADYDFMRFKPTGAVWELGY